MDEIEAEFWRIVERSVNGQVVEALYGSDLDSARHGSGFPLPPWRAPPKDARPGEAAAAMAALGERGAYYACHPWNINNLPRSAGSVLRFMQTDELITGGGTRKSRGSRVRESGSHRWGQGKGSWLHT